MSGRDTAGAAALLSLCALLPLSAAGPSAGPPVSLEEATKMALSASPVLRIAEERLHLARLERSLACSSFLPRLQLGYSQQREVDFYGADGAAHRFSLTLIQRLYDGGRTRSARYLATLHLETAEAEYTRLREELEDQVWRLYHSRAVQQHALELQRRIHDSARRNTRLAEAQHKLGMITEIELLAVRQHQADLRLSRSTTEHRLRQNGRRLRKLLGLGVGSPLRICEAVPVDYEGVELHADAAELAALALRRNRSLRDARRRAAEQQARLHLVRTAYLPLAEIEAGVHIEGDRFPLHRSGFTVSLSLRSSGSPAVGSARLALSAPEPARRGRSLSLSASPLQDPAALTEAQRARIDYGESHLKLRDAGKQIRITLAALLEEHRAARERLVLLRRAAALARRRSVLVRKRLESGQVTADTLAEAHNRQLTAQQAVLEHLLELMLLERRIERSLGIAPGELAALNDRYAREERGNGHAE